MPLGRPLFFVMSIHVSPRSTDFHIPLSGPPLVKVHGSRFACHIAANIILEFFGLIDRSIPPVSGLLYNTFFQLLPPSTDLKIPRSLFGPKACPSAETYNILWSLGSILILEICCVSFNPIFSHVLPPSVVLYTPSPWQRLPRIQASPVPTYITFGSDCEISIAPIDALVKNPSEIFSQYVPPSSVFQTPPPLAPK